MSEYVFAGSLKASACGKAILVGEHAAVYGHPALAVALGDVGLHIELCAPGQVLRHATGEHSEPVNWEHCWEFNVRGHQLIIPAEQRTRLSAALALAWQICAKNEASLNLNSKQHLRQQLGKSLEEFTPQILRVYSEIPLGAGMGGSAALSTAMVRLVMAILGRECCPPHELAKIATEVDCLFHGVASGLDTAAIASNGVIEFVRGRGAQSVQVGRGFWLVLVDSGERKQTAHMVDLVAKRRAENLVEVDQWLAALGNIALMAKNDLEQGNTLSLGQGFTRAHELLRCLGVSTPRIEERIQALEACGALGAKVTGGGGGGFVLGVFECDPTRQVASLAREGLCLVTFVASSL